MDLNRDIFFIQTLSPIIIWYKQEQQMRRYRKPQKFRQPGTAEIFLRRVFDSSTWRVMRTIVFPALILYLAYSQTWGHEERRDEIVSTFVSIRYSAEHLPQFMLQELEIQGLPDRLEDEIRKSVDIEFPISLFHLDEETLKAELSGIREISYFSIEPQGGGNLIVTAIPSIPIAVWRTTEGYSLINAAGREIADVFHPGQEKYLPMVIGAGANIAAHEISYLHRISKPIRNDIYAFIRVGERRWDIMLHSGLLIMLPADDPITAIRTVMRWEERHAITSRLVSRIDLRLMDTPLFRGIPEEDIYLYFNGKI
jgi:cell division protein FtsQ